MKKSAIRQEQLQALLATNEMERVAWTVLKALDKSGQGGVEENDPFSGGLVRVHRDEDGRLYIRTPRGVDLSTRLDVRMNRVGWRENKKRLADFLARHPLAYSFVKAVFQAK